MVRLPHHAGSAAAARRRVRSALPPERVGGELADDVVLVVSELVANAVRHARPLSDGALEIAWEVHRESVELRVTDGDGGDEPTPRRAGIDDVRGRGLNIVTRLAAAWGVEHGAHRTTVWAMMAAPSRGRVGPRRQYA